MERNIRIMVQMYVEIFLNKQWFLVSFISKPPLLAVMMPLTAALVQFGYENAAFL